nr:NUDIX domain-containing protein [uncultured Dyadobacter sp.]
MRELDIDNYIPNLSIDCVIFGFRDRELRVLISKFKFGAGAWSLPGGYIVKTESTDQAASRILCERTGLDNIYLEQFRVFGDQDRIVTSKYNQALRTGLQAFDPERYTDRVVDWMTGRFVGIGYYALVDINKVSPQAGRVDDYLEWRSVKDIPEMMHDHSQILGFALEALRQNLDEKLIGFNLLPETFTMREIMELYEAVYDKPFAINNFSKKMADLNVLERLQKRYTGAANTAPYLYRFKMSDKHSSL